MLRLLCLLCCLSACGLPDNPAVEREIRWVDADTEALARRACYDCHSNETEWKGVHRVPLVNGWVRGHVRDGRCHLNFSDWDGPNEEAWEAAEEVLDEDMPLPSYRRAHKDARLTDAERERLADGLERTFALDPPAEGEACDD